MAKSRRVIFQLECSGCKARNYTSSKNPDNIALKTKDQNTKLKFSKYCKHCRKKTEHREVKI